jgi:hypothetical protein
MKDKKNIYNGRLRNAKEMPLYDIEELPIYKIGKSKKKK